MRRQFVYLYDDVLAKLINEALDQIDNDDPNLSVAVDAYVAVRVDELLRIALGVAELSADPDF